MTESPWYKRAIIVCLVVFAVSLAVGMATCFAGLMWHLPTTGRAAALAVSALSAAMVSGILAAVLAFAPIVAEEWNNVER